MVDTIILRDSVYLKDSIILRERNIHDTVYITKEVYRNQRLSTLDTQHSTHVDTVRVVEYRDRVVEKPPERYVPKFYKGCAWALGAILGVLGVLVFLKVRRR